MNTTLGPWSVQTGTTVTDSFVWVIPPEVPPDLAGVREPRLPHPSSGSGSVALVTHPDPSTVYACPAMSPQGGNH